MPADLLNQDLLYPLQSNIPETEIQTAARVAKLVFDAGLARVKRPADMVAFILQGACVRGVGAKAGRPAGIPGSRVFFGQFTEAGG